MTSAEAATLLNVQQSRIRQLCGGQSPRIVATKRGRDWWIEPDALAAYTPGKPGRKPKAQNGVEAS